MQYQIFDEERLKTVQSWHDYKKIPQNLISFGFCIANRSNFLDFTDVFLNYP